MAFSSSASTETDSKNVAAFKLTPKTRKITKYKTALYRLKKRLFFSNTQNNNTMKKLLEQLKTFEPNNLLYCFCSVEELSFVR